MAKGEITFYFDTLADLQAQLLETLGMGTPAGADRPVAWLGSTITGRCVRRFKTGIAERSSVLRV